MPTIVLNGPTIAVDDRYGDFSAVISDYDTEDELNQASVITINSSNPNDQIIEMHNGALGDEDGLQSLMLNTYGGDGLVDFRIVWASGPRQLVITNNFGAEPNPLLWDLTPRSGVIWRRPRGTLVPRWLKKRFGSRK